MKIKEMIKAAAATAEEAKSAAKEMFLQEFLTELGEDKESGSQ